MKYEERKKTFLDENSKNKSDNKSDYLIQQNFHLFEISYQLSRIARALEKK